jgi:Fe-S oxidoreductase
MAPSLQTSVRVGPRTIASAPRPCYDPRVASPRALAYLAWRALIAHPAKRLFRQRGTGLERFRANYVVEGLVPTRPEDRDVGEAAARCIACGLCEVGCDLAGAAPVIRALGLHAAFRLYSRGPAELPLAADALRACCACTGCDARCPTGVPISRIVRHLAARAEELGRAGVVPQPRPSSPAAGGDVTPPSRTGSSPSRSA